MKDIGHNNNLIDLSKHDTVFCDSLQALDWAYKNKLPRSAVIKTSAPAMLWKNFSCMSNVESFWTVEKIGEFQNTISRLTEDMFDAALSVNNVNRELALCVSLAAHKFQHTLYKAACLEDDDFVGSRLFIHTHGKTGPSGDMMNHPWDQLLSSNPLFSKINYTLKNDKWSMLSTQGVSYFQRFKVAGYETILYRLIIKLMDKLPNWMFKKELLLPNENELNIEISSLLALRGVRIKKVSIYGLPDDIDSTLLDTKSDLLCKVALPIMRKRIEKWVSPLAVETTTKLFQSYLKEQFLQFSYYANEWEKSIVKSNKIKQAVLVNAPGNIKGQALAYICRKKNIPLMTSQHGVTLEITNSQNMMHIGSDNSVADVVFSYNKKIVDVEKNMYFDKSKHYIVGMPMRLIRMKKAKTINNPLMPIAYISTNFYHMSFNIPQKIDYIKALDENKLITEVLDGLPHRVLYKTYPYVNRRCADEDPVLNTVRASKNIHLFSDKIDMRYLISRHSVFITTCATSTLGWPVMSGKPVIFINQKYNSSLTSDAYASISKGIFVFNDDDVDFHKKLRSFLSKPIGEIEALWESKKNARKEMIRDFFSAHENGAGNRAAKIIIEKYLS
jgi:hypothetical protein